MRGIRIGIVCFPSVGGSGVVAADLGLELARRGHQVHFIGSGLPFRLASHGLDHGRPDGSLAFHPVEAPRHPLFPEPLYYLSLTNQLARVARREDLDVLHVHYAIPHAACACQARDMLAGERRGPAVVTTLHGSDVTVLGCDPALRDVTAHNLAASDAVTAVSRFLREEAARRLDLAVPIEVVTNFVNPDVFHPRPDPPLRRLFAADEERLVVHVSNFRPLKRVPEVVRLFALISRQVSARLLLVGEGPEVDSTRQEAAALGLGERVRFLGRQAEVAPLLGVADLFLFPSLNESFGVAAAEAMSCGVPVIASDVGGLRELVEHGRTGFLFAPEDGEGMAAQAIALLRDPDLSRRIGQAAARHARAAFSPARVVPLYEAVYQRAVTCRGGRRPGVPCQGGAGRDRPDGL